MRKQTLRLLMAAAGVVMCACSSSTSPVSVAGRYGLQTVDQAALPYQALVADTITLTPDGRVSRCFLTRSSDPTVPGLGLCYPDAGTYSVTGESIAFSGLTSNLGAGYSPASGSVTGGELRLSQFGHAYVYHK